MKVGILTFHRAHNYGAVLQCYALQEILKGMGHDVSVIDYRQPYIEYAYSNFHIKKLLSKFPNIFKVVKYLLACLKRFVFSSRAKYFTDFRDKFLNQTFEVGVDDLASGLDVVVIGSDQLWNKNCTGGEFENVYCGDFDHKKAKVVGYAISADRMSLASIDFIGNDSHFDNLSFREKFIVDYVFDKHGLEYPICLDPTLVASPEIWNKVLNDKWKSKKYIAIYQVRCGSDRNMLVNKAKILAAKIGKDCEIINLSSMEYSVVDFVSIIKYAQYVLTTSFHATVFSLILETPFYSIKLNDGCDGRYSNLLDSLGLDEYCVDADFKPELLTYNFDEIHKSIDILKSSSYEFLKSNCQHNA